MEYKETWGIPDELKVLIKGGQQDQFMCDNMIIENDGNVEPFDDEGDIQEALERPGGITTDVEDIAHIVIGGLDVSFKLVDRVYLDTDTVLDPSQILSLVNEMLVKEFDYIVVLNTPDNESRCFSKKDAMLKFIVNKPASDIDCIFSEGRFVNADQYTVLKVEDKQEYEFEKVPF